MAGSRGDHCTSKVGRVVEGSSQTMSPVDTSQQMVRLSLPEERSRLESCGHHEAARMPLVCPCSSRTGMVALRRSQIWSTGDRSSAEATRTSVAASGFHVMTELRCVLLFGSWKEMTGFLSLRSHTTLRPLCEVDARMCCTLRFHATLEMSEGGPLLLAPGE